GRCAACHGEAAPTLGGGLDLPSRTPLLRGGDSKPPAVAVGRATESPLYKAITRTSDDFRPMPPKENDKLSDADVKAFREWIDGGAPWPSAERVAQIVKAVQATRVKVRTSGRPRPQWTK